MFIPLLLVFAQCVTETYAVSLHGEAGDLYVLADRSSRHHAAGRMAHQISRTLLNRTSIHEVTDIDVSRDGVNKIVQAGITDEATATGIAQMMVTIDGNDTTSSDPYILNRFYEAASGNIEDAVKLFRTISEWRRTYPGTLRGLMKLHSADDYYTSEETRLPEGCTQMYKNEPSSLEGKFARKYVCFSRHSQMSPLGEPIQLWSWDGLNKNGLLDSSNSVLLKRAFTAHVEDMYQCVQSLSQQQKKPVQSHIIIDAANVGITDIPNVVRFQHLTEFAQETYPYCSKTVSFIRAPAMFSFVFKVVKPLLSKHIRENVRIFTSDFKEDLKERTGIDVATLPQRFGGDASDDGLCTFGEPIPADTISAVTATFS
jgi:hypothetical protein